VGPIISRDTWNHFAVLYNFSAQTFDVFVNGVLIRAGSPFPNAQATFAVGLFQTFGGFNGNDKGYIDNFRVTAVNR
jgi:hypothetical protein